MTGEDVLRRALHAEADTVSPPAPDFRRRAELAQARRDFRKARRPWWRRFLPARKTAAPGCLPGRPTEQAVYQEGTTAMAHTLESERTARGHQMAAALALFHLLETGPREDAEWKVDAIGRLHGHVHRAHSDHEARRAIDAFAEFLRADVGRSQGRTERSEWVHLHTSGVYRGVPINVWTHVDIRATNPYGGAA